ncbi:hypothetical protein [Leifsonia sp. AG29]|uniref:hypothetical protein n=1 Tax=Leifsonia sp. AG29 TaxID=2598860 RepID=UPI00131D86F0|nr:hypothetical protein [Leifsonia sp. AG29]
MNRQEAHQSNVGLQRQSALAFRDEWPAVEMIRFMHEGGAPGFGASWRVDAVAIVSGVEYQAIIGLGISPAFHGGMPPESPGSPSRPPLRVVYSDGASEVIE